MSAGNDDTDDRGAPPAASAEGPPDDRKVKELLDPATVADLERWFTLPSYEQLADRGVRPEPPPEDPETVKLLERRAAAIAAADPVLIAEIDRRLSSGDDLIEPWPEIATLDTRPVARFDTAMAERRLAIAEGREYERSPDIEDQLAESTPQALLRDLHRPELYFEKVYERYDPEAASRYNASGEVAAVMATRWKPVLEPLAATQARAARGEITTLLRGRWDNLPIPSRQVPE